MTTVFTKIIDGALPAHVVARDSKHVAFLDIAPTARGHTLVVPRQVVDYIFDMEDDDLARLMIFAKKVACSLKRVVACERVVMKVVGFEVPHVHVHLIPVDKEADLKKSVEAGDAALRVLAEKITADYQKAQ